MQKLGCARTFDLKSEKKLGQRVLHAGRSSASLTAPRSPMEMMSKYVSVVIIHNSTIHNSTIFFKTLFSLFNK